MIESFTSSVVLMAGSTVFQPKIVPSIFLHMKVSQTFSLHLNQAPPLWIYIAS